MSARLEEQAENDYVDDMSDDRDRGGLNAVVEGEKTRRLEHGGAGRAGPVRRHPRVEAREQREKHRHRDADVQETEQPAEPPGGPIQQGEGGGVAEGE